MFGEQLEIAPVTFSISGTPAAIPFRERMAAFSLILQNVITPAIGVTPFLAICLRTYIRIYNNRFLFSTNTRYDRYDGMAEPLFMRVYSGIP